MLQAKDAVDPRATRVSMLGAPWNRLLKPLMKNFWLMTMTMPASSSWTRATAMWLPSNQAGRAQPHIMCPIEKYISTSKKPREATRRRRSLGVSWSARASRAASGEGAAAAPAFCLGLAP